VLHPPHEWGRPVNWDDLRVIAAVREQGTYAGASAQLRIDETTVARRVTRLQRALGVTLFEAADGMRRPTADCEAILGHVHEIARRVSEIGTIGKAMRGPVGRFRIASTDLVAEEILAPRAAPFLRANPGLTLQFMTSDENINFLRWEADFAVRLRKPERGHFVITRLADVRLYLFEPTDTPEAAGAPLVCRFPDLLDGTPQSRYLMAKGLHAQGRCITANYRVTRRLIESRMAIGILPEHMCADFLADPKLRATPLEHGQEAWLLVQNHLKRDPAARTVIDWIRESFERLAGR
jgi:DNA-binding transcriptional LysR family regulator